MKFDEVMVLLPCQSLEEFPSHLQGADAEGLLAAWSALWHPALLAATGRLPTWRNAGSVADGMAGKLIVVPAVAERVMAEGTIARAKADGGQLILGLQRRPEIVAALLAALGGGESAGETPAPQAAIDPHLVDDFLALGTCHLYGELLARRMRYSSTVDEARLQSSALAAATAAVGGDAEAARNELTSAFAVLVEGRGRYYPVDPSLVDLTLVARTTLGASLRKELSAAVRVDSAAGSAASLAPRPSPLGPSSPQPINLMISADVLAEMAEREPASLAALREALDREMVSLVGGEVDEAKLPLLEPESVLWNLTAGLAEYQRLLGRRPVVYGRRRYGLTPILPQILFQLGFRGAVHFTLDDGRFPQADGGKSRWEGLDVMGIDALSRVPLDASLPASLLGLAEKLGHAMDHDHVATVAFAHWPSQGNMFYDDLRRASAFAPVLGKFVALENYFSDTGSSGSYSKFTADQYRTPYLQQAAERGKPDALSRWVRHQRRCHAADACQTIATLVSLLRQTDATDGQLRSDIERSHLADAPAIDAAAETTADGEANIDRRLAERLSLTVGQLSAALPRDKRTPQRGYLIVNPASYKRRVLVDLPELSMMPADELPVLATEEHGGKRRALVELPPVGFAWVAPAGDQPIREWSGDPIASNLLLRNEHCEVRIHPETGGIQSIHDYKGRANRLSQQLAFRLPPVSDAADSKSAASGDEAAFSRMVADSIEVTDGGRLFGEITSRGQLVDPEGSPLAEFTQRVRMTLGSRVIVVEIDLNPTAPPRPDPWRSYYACRFAWADRGTDLARDVHFTSQPTSAKRIEAPHFIEMQSGSRRIAVLTGGLPYHCRFGARMLDSLLIVHGETCRRFRLGIGIDLPHPLCAALDFSAPEAIAVEEASAPAPARHGWLFNVGARNVVATHWEPLLAGDGEGSGDDLTGDAVSRAIPSTIVGFRVRLVETEGRGGRVHLRSYRTPTAARRTDFQRRATGDLGVEGDRIALDLGAFEWMQVEVRW
jgi:alpha-mannosidase